MGRQERIIREMQEWPPSLAEHLQVRKSTSRSCGDGRLKAPSAFILDNVDSGNI